MPLVDCAGDRQCWTDCLICYEQAL